MKRASVILLILLSGMGLAGGLMAMETAVSLPTAVSPGGATPLAEPASCLGNNLLTNPGFEGEYTKYIFPGGHVDCQDYDNDGINETCERAKMPDGWHPRWLPDGTEEWIVMPEYTQSTPDQINPDRVRSGDKSLHYWSTWTRHETAVHQQIDAVPGASYCFSVWGHAWSDNMSEDWYSATPDRPWDDGNLYQRVGIDPTGGIDWQSANVIWSDARKQYDYFGEFTVTAAAAASKITVFLYSTTAAPVRFNDVYWDDAFLTREMMLAVKQTTIGMIADDDIPQTTTATVAIDLSPGLTWTASLDPMGAITPTLSAASGLAGENLDVTLSSNGYPTGTYTTTLTIASSAGVLGSPATVPITLWVVQEVNYVFLPAVSKP